MEQEVEDDYKSIFEKYDLDGSGSLERDEIIKILTEFKGRAPTQKQLDKFFSSVDSNNDGKISFQEFKKVLCDMRTSKQDEIKKCFQIFDTNGNGLIDKSELENIITMTGDEISSMSLDLLWETYDTNHDGAIDFKEFLSIYKDLGI